MAKMEKIPVILHKRIFQKLFKIAEVANLKKEEYMLYEKALLDKWTDYSVRKTAEEKIKTAEKKGMEKGMEKGAEQKTREVVKKLINKLGFTDAQISDIAGVSIDYVKKIRLSLKKKK
jgi:flagellar biosynthesis/type III secretory pathway protein FliH